MSSLIVYRFFCRSFSYLKIISGFVLVPLSHQLHRLFGYIIAIKSYISGVETRPALQSKDSCEKSSRKQSARKVRKHRCNSKRKMSMRKRAKTSLQFITRKKKKMTEKSAQNTLDRFLVALDSDSISGHPKDYIKYPPSKDLSPTEGFIVVEIENPETTETDQEGRPTQLNGVGMSSKKDEKDIVQSSKINWTKENQSSNEERQESKDTTHLKTDSENRSSSDKTPVTSSTPAESSKDKLSSEGKNDQQAREESVDLKTDAKTKNRSSSDKTPVSSSTPAESSKDKLSAEGKNEQQATEGSLDLKNPKPSAEKQMIASTSKKVQPGATSKAKVPQDKNKQRGIKDHDISDSETGSESSSDTQPISSGKVKPWTFQKQKSPSKSPRRQQPSLLPSSWSSRDTEAYRNGYPGKRDNIHLNDNLNFYSNSIECKPRGTLIDTMHIHWFGDYSLLEEHHGYIQWLFPIREQGMNWQSQELQLHEAKRISTDAKMRDRVLNSYEMMLHFWGMHLEDRRTGEIRREINWKERFRNLNRSSHNYLRITRVLKSLGELGFEHLKLPFLKFVLREIILEKTLSNAQTSCLNYWIYTLRKGKELEEIRFYAEKLLSKTCKY